MRTRHEPPGNLVAAILEHRERATAILRDPHAVAEVLGEAAKQAAPDRRLCESLMPLGDFVRASVLGTYRAAEEEDVALALAAAMYVASAWDLSPDHMPGGLQDDQRAVAWVHQQLAEPLVEFVAWQRAAAKRYRTVFSTRPR